MTQVQFMHEMREAMFPILKKYAIANGTDDPETVGFIVGAISGYAAGIGRGAGLDKNTTISLCTVGAVAGYEGKKE